MTAYGVTHDRPIRAGGAHFNAANDGADGEPNWRAAIDMQEAPCHPCEMCDRGIIRTPAACEMGTRCECRRYPGKWCDHFIPAGQHDCPGCDGLGFVVEDEVTQEVCRG